ncbi:MAG TPA: LptF/LptG family permease [Myxococcota bacterium]|nr:LptF/LptG family permease [Myxococcota bacterium]
MAQIRSKGPGNPLVSSALSDTPDGLVPAAAPADPARSRRPGPLLYRYVAAELLLPTLLALGGLGLVVVAKDMLGWADLVTNREIGLGRVAAIAALQLVPVVAQLLPFALLLGALVALGRLREDLEIVALEASGIAPHGLAGPLLAVAVAVALVAGAFQLELAPRAERHLRAALTEVMLASPGAPLRGGISQEYGGRRLEAREVSPKGDRLRGVLLWMPDVGETVYAEDAEIASRDAATLVLTLHDGEVLLRPAAGARELRFHKLETDLAQDLDAALGDAADPLTAASDAELAVLARGEAGGATAGPAVLARRAAGERARRRALPAATVVFALVALPLALGGLRFSRAQGAVVGLLVTLAYYGLVQLGSGLSRAGTVGATAAAWLPNAAMLALAALLLAVFVRAGGREPVRRARAGDIASGGAWPRRFALSRDVAAGFVELFALFLAALAIGYLLVDVLERLQWFARYEARFADALRWYGARVPLLATRVFPMALLAASGLAVARLAASGELVAMLACGLSPRRALAPIALCVLLLAPIHALLSEGVLPGTNRLADEIKDARIKHSDEVASQSIWARDGDRVVRADSLDARQGLAENLTVYQLDAEGRPVARIDAPRARDLGDGRFALEEATQIRITEHGLAREAPPSVITLDQRGGAPLDTTHLTLGELGAEIARAERSRLDATTLRVDRAARIAAPLASLLLPLLGVLATAVGPPFLRPALAVLVCAALGVGYQVLGAVGISLGYGKTLPPWLAGGLPVAAGLLGVLALWLRRRD